MNVLLTSVGRRAYMVKYFKNVLGESGQVHVCNSDDKTVAFSCADKSVISPLIYSDAYIPFLLNYCKENRIDLLLSLFDMDLPVLAGNIREFAAIGTRVVVSDPSLIEVCNDKWKTYRFLKEKGFRVPKTYLTLESVCRALEQGELKYPVIVKPRFGCGSIALAIAEDETDLHYYVGKNTRTIGQSYLKYESGQVAAEEQLIFQECLRGQEYGVDIINDLDGNFQNAIVKKKLAMRAGETDIAELEDVPVIRSEAERLGRCTAHVANMDVDFFLVEGEAYVLEMNARFGGGYPFSHTGGCDLPRAIVSWAKGELVSQEILRAKTGIRVFKELVLTVSHQ